MDVSAVHARIMKYGLLFHHVLNLIVQTSLSPKVRLIGTNMKLTSHVISVMNYLTMGPSAVTWTWKNGLHFRSVCQSTVETLSYQSLETFLTQTDRQHLGQPSRWTVTKVMFQHMYIIRAVCTRVSVVVLSNILQVNERTIDHSCNIVIYSPLGNHHIIYPGEWRHNLTCDPVDCGAISLQPNSYIVSGDNYTTYRAKQEVGCSPRFSLTGLIDNSTQIVSCGADEQWNASYSCEVEGRL